MSDLLDKLAPAPEKRKRGRPRKHPLPPPPAELAVDKLAVAPIVKVAMFEPPADLPPEVRAKTKLYAERNAQREMILALTGNGIELVLHAIQEMRGQRTYIVVNKDGEPVEVGPSAQDEDRAREFLAKYALTPAPKELKVTGADGGPVEVSVKYDYSKLNDEELAQMERLLSKATVKPAVNPGPMVDAVVESEVAADEQSE